MIHCSLCDVCIEGYDHHCVFFSKCIGKGTIWSFRLSLISAIMSGVYFMIFTGYVNIKTHGIHHAKPPPPLPTPVSPVSTDPVDSLNEGNESEIGWES